MVKIMNKNFFKVKSFRLTVYESKHIYGEGILKLSILIKHFEYYDHVWQTRKQWRAVYAMIGPFAEENGDQYVALINDTTKEYMIIYSDHLENGFQDEHFKFVTQEEHILLIEQLKNSGYQILSCSEEYYYSEILDQ